MNSQQIQLLQEIQAHYQHKPVKDILYNICFHEEPQSIIDCLINIAIYNSHLSFAIVCHLNHDMLKALNKLKLPSFIIINPQAWNKRLMSSDLVAAYRDNFRYCQKIAFKARYTCLLASNCLFYKPLQLDLLTQRLDAVPENAHIKLDNLDSKADKWPFNIIQLDYLTAKIFHKEQLPCMKLQHEGFICRWSIFQAIIDKIEAVKLIPSAKLSYPCEEVFFHSLYYHITGQEYAPLICKVFWQAENYTLSLEELKKYIFEHLNNTAIAASTNHNSQNFPGFVDHYAIKRIVRNYNDSSRVYLREEANKYWRGKQIETDDFSIASVI